MKKAIRELSSEFLGDSLLHLVRVGICMISWWLVCTIPPTIHPLPSSCVLTNIHKTGDCQCKLCQYCMVCFPAISVDTYGRFTICPKSNAMSILYYVLQTLLENPSLPEDIKQLICQKYATSDDLMVSFNHVREREGL